LILKILLFCFAVFESGKIIGWLSCDFDIGLGGGKWDYKIIVEAFIIF
jgi:hypothetical protein